jgi:hypothetical protein
MKKMKPHLRYLALLILVIPFSSVLFVNCSPGFQSVTATSNLSSSSGGDGAPPSTIPVGTLPTTTSTSSTTTTTMSAPVGGGNVISGHPRIWLSDPANFSRIKSAVSANSSQWSKLKSFCDNTSTAIPQGNAYQGDLQLQALASFALCYQMTGSATYAQKAVTLLTTNDCASMKENTYGCSPLYFNIYSTDSGYGIRNYVPALALAYDWLYPYMSTAVSVSDLSAKTLGAALIQRMNAWLSWFAKSGYCRINDSNCQNFPSPHTGIGIANYYSGYVLAQSLAAVAIGGDDSTGASVYSMANTVYNNGIGDMDTYFPEGHHPEGSYGSGTYERYLLSGTALRWGTGNTAYLNSKWMMNYPTFKLAAITNDGKFYIDDGMWHSDVEPTSNDSILSGYAFGWNSSIGQTTAAYLGVMGSTSAIASSGDAWKSFLFYDSTAAATPLANVAKSLNASVAGVSMARSDWTSATATWSMLKVAGWTDTEGEDYANAGQFQIYKGSPLLMNAGFGDRWGASQEDTASYFNTFSFENRTDGGPKGQPWFTTSGCPNPTGSDPIGLKKFKDGSDYVFASGEFSAAYQKSCSASGVPANFVVRNQLYVRPDLFFIYDQVSVKNGTPTEHFHFPTSPVASGSNQWTITNGKGLLQVAAISPAVTASVATQAASSLKYSDGSNGPQMTNYHLTMAAKTQTSYQSFLNVFRAALSNGSYPFPTMQAITASVGSGVRVSGMQASENTTAIVAVFADNTQNTPSTSVQYVVPTSAGTYHYVALLQPNTVYKVTESVSGGQTTISISPDTSGNVTSDGAGVIRFTE